MENTLEMKEMRKRRNQEEENERNKQKQITIENETQQLNQLTQKVKENQIMVSEKSNWKRSSCFYL